jgi:hypothetical protein
MFDWEEDTWMGKARGIASISANHEDGDKESYRKRLFMWLCKVFAMKYGDPWWFAGGTGEDFSLSLPFGTTIGWGYYDNGFRLMQSYAEVHINQYATIKRKHKVQYVRKPFKGGSAYEWQIGGIVLMIYYPHSQIVPDRKLWRVGWFWDCYWTGRFTPSPLTRVVNWLSRKGGMSSFDEDASEYAWSVGPLMFKSIYDPRLNFYTVIWGERTLWHAAD